VLDRPFHVLFPERPENSDTADTPTSHWRRRQDPLRIRRGLDEDWLISESSEGFDIQGATREHVGMDTRIPGSRGFETSVSKALLDGTWEDWGNALEEAECAVCLELLCGLPSERPEEIWFDGRLRRSRNDWNDTELIRVNFGRHFMAEFGLFLRSSELLSSRAVLANSMSERSTGIVSYRFGSNSDFRDCGD